MKEKYSRISHFSSQQIVSLFANGHLSKQLIARLSHDLMDKQPDTYLWGLIKKEKSEKTADGEQPTVIPLKYAPYQADILVGHAGGGHTPSWSDTRHAFGM